MIQKIAGNRCRTSGKYLPPYLPLVVGVSVMSREWHIVASGKRVMAWNIPCSITSFLHKKDIICYFGSKLQPLIQFSMQLEPSNTGWSRVRSKCKFCKISKQETNTLSFFLWHDMLWKHIPEVKMLQRRYDSFLISVIWSFGMLQNVWVQMRVMAWNIPCSFISIFA